MDFMAYPHISYDPEGMHCAYGFFGRFKIADPRPPKDESLNIGQREKIWFEEIRKEEEKFPSAEGLKKAFPYEQEKWMNKFIGPLGKIDYFQRDECLLEIALSFPPLSPNIEFKLEFGAHFNYSLHNAQTPNLALIMYSHGLSALKEIYRSFGIETKLLPSISFSERGVGFNVPCSRDESLEGFVGMSEENRIERAAIKFVEKVGEGKDELVKKGLLFFDERFGG